MLKIGEFSKLGQVSPKALRLYAERGLLEPAWIDRFTGYRYYEAGQLARLHRILALKDLGFSLDEIGELLAGDLDAQALGELMRARKRAIQRQIASEEARLRRVEARLLQLEAQGEPPAYDVVLKPLQPMAVAGLRRKLPGQEALPALLAELQAALLPGQAGAPLLALYYDRLYRERNIDVEVAAPISGGTPASPALVAHELPGATLAACTVHRGSFGSLGGAYEALLGWLDSGGYRSAGPNRELYLQLPRSAGDEAVAELQLPVERKPFLSVVATNMEQTKMEVKIESRPAFRVVGLAYYGKNENNEIAGVWDVLNGRAAEVRGRTGPAYGVCAPMEADGHFRYLAGFGVTAAAAVPAGMEAWEVPARTYAVFPCTLDSVHATYQYAYDTWQKESGRTLAAELDFELYGEEFDPQTGRGTLYVYVPLAGAAGK